MQADHADRRRPASASLETSAVTLGEAGGAPRFAEAVREGGLDAEGRDLPGDARRPGRRPEGRSVPADPRLHRQRSDEGAARLEDHREPVPARRPHRRRARYPSGFRSVPRSRGRSVRQCPDRPAGRTRGDGLCREIDAGHGRADRRDLAAGRRERKRGRAAGALRRQRSPSRRNGAWPLGLWGEYRTDDAEIARYAPMARTRRASPTTCATFVQAVEAAA